MAESCRRSSEKQRDELVTAARRQPRGEYKDTIDHISELERRLSEQQQQQLEMSETLEKLAETEVRLKRLEDGSQDQIDQEQLTAALDQLNEVMRYDLQLEAARSELQNLEVQLEQAQRIQSDRASRRAELKTDQERLRQETKRLEELQEQERESLASLEELRQASTNCRSSRRGSAAVGSELAPYPGQDRSLRRVERPAPPAERSRSCGGTSRRSPASGRAD